MTFNKLVIALAAAGFTSGAYATNGMNLEGYGPIATGMGGASMAYDNGTAAVMNNPATLGLMGQGSRFDLAVGMLGPDVSMKVDAPAPGTSSGGDAYYMPAVGWAKKDGALTYGVAMFAQGGMGTEWEDANFLNYYSVDGMSQRSEVGVGRLIAPLAYEVNPDFVVGGSLDFVWAMMDLKMALPGFYFATADNGGLVTSKTGAYAGIPDSGLEGAGRIDFSDSNDYTGKAKSTGWAGKLGFTYKLSPTVTLGGTYHSKTALGDLKTSASGATFYGDMNGDGSYDPMAGEVSPGKITVHNFEWPETYGLGLAIQATPDILVAMDYKRIGWSDVMKNFSMTFSNAYGTASFSMPQNWDDQDVFSIGVAYKATNALTLRAGANLSSNPIPDSYLNYLFPAIVEDHYTVGFGYAFNPASSLDFSLQYAPEVTATNPGMPSMGIPAVAQSHGQTSWQLMYSQKF